MKAKLAVIGGTSLLNSSLFSHLKPTIVETPYGKAIVYTSDNDQGSENDVIFVQRHHADGDAGSSVYRPPHLINHRANLHAISQFEVSSVLAMCSVGTLTSKFPIGTLLLPDDYFGLFSSVFCVHNDDRGHIVPGINQNVRDVLVSTLKQHAQDIQGLSIESAVYVQSDGPRFETCAESKFLAKTGGDIVGMTAANEATAAKELGLRYAILAMVDNFANGLTDENLTHKKFKANVASNQSVVEQAVKLCVEKLLTCTFE